MHDGEAENPYGLGKSMAEMLFEKGSSDTSAWDRICLKWAGFKKNEEALQGFLEGLIAIRIDLGTFPPILFDISGLDDLTKALLSIAKDLPILTELEEDNLGLLISILKRVKPWIHSVRLRELMLREAGADIQEVDDELSRQTMIGLLEAMIVHGRKVGFCTKARDLYLESSEFKCAPARGLAEHIATAHGVGLLLKREVRSDLLECIEPWSRFFNWNLFDAMTTYNQVTDQSLPWKKRTKVFNNVMHAGANPLQTLAKALKIPIETAGEASAEPLPGIVKVLSPSLPPLVPWQTRVKNKLLQALNGEPGRNRAVLAMPTGSGKTRVAVELLLQWMFDRASEDAPRPSVLWVMPQDVLGEQAVACFAQVWREGLWVGDGESRRLLTGCLNIVRAWADYGNPLEALRTPGSLVLTTPAKLALMLNGIDNFKKPDAVVFDEAHKMHHEWASTIRKVLGATYLTDKSVIPLIGLTATPYRNESEIMTWVNYWHGLVISPLSFGVREYRLIGQTPRAMLDTLRSDLITVRRWLEEDGVLSSVERKTGQGIEVELTPSEAAGFTTFKEIQTGVLHRMGEDRDRTGRLVTTICQCFGEDLTHLPGLVFTASVQEAHRVAFKLTGAGFRARSIDGSARGSTRAAAIRDLKEGRIDFLVNCNLLTTGFDCPMLRSVVVARPTTSDTLYEQMIGRGVRGPKFGGTDSCLIVDLEDRINLPGWDSAATRWHNNYSGND